jgi:hypothetical protein
MNILLVNILCLLFSFNANKSESIDLKYGFYYGRNKGFFPQNIVYVKINKDNAIVECFLPLKGQFFNTFNDTLIIKNEKNILYSSGKCIIFFKKEKLFFKTIIANNNYNISETKITYQPDKEKEYNDIKSMAKPIKE